MLRYLRFALIGLFALTLAVATTGLLASKEESLLATFYETFFGPPDLGPVTFETLVRRSTPNDALACPTGLCAAAADFDPGVHQGSDEDLRRRFAAVALADERVVPLYRSDAPGRPMQDRYLQRSRLMSYPDTIDVRFIALGNDTATLAVYSRSQLGRSDFGVNLARIRRWVDAAMVRAQPAGSGATPLPPSDRPS